MIEPMFCGDAALISTGMSIAQDMGLDARAFCTGAQCRVAVAQSPEALVFVGSKLRDVDPLNLVAALRKDVGPSCRIVLFQEQEIGGSLSSRGIAAGADALATDGVREETIRCQLESLIAAPPRHAGGVDAEDPLGRSGELLLESELDALIEAAPPRRPARAVTRSAVKQGFVICFASGRGGQGKSTLALLTAMALASDGSKKVALLDLDLQFGEQAFLLGQQEPPRLDALAARLEQGADIGQILPGFLVGAQQEIELMAAPNTPEAGDRVLPYCALIIQELKRRFDFVVVDTGGFWTEAHADALQMADICLLLCQQTASSLHACKQVLSLCSRLHIPRVKLACVINRYVSKGSLLKDDIRFALDGLSCYTVSQGDGEVEDLLSSGCAHELFALRNPCAESISRMLEELLGRAGLSCQLTARRRLVPEASMLPWLPKRLKRKGGE